MAQSLGEFVEDIVGDYFINDDEYFDSKYLFDFDEEEEWDDEGEFEKLSAPAYSPSVCSIDYCDKEANESGFCEYHRKLAEAGIIFETRKQETNYFRSFQPKKEKEKKNRCIIPGCPQVTKTNYRVLCPRHHREVVKYGHTITEGLGRHRVFIYKNKKWNLNFGEVVVYRPQINDFVSLILDYPFYHEVRRSKILFLEHGVPWMIQKRGKKKKIANHVLGLANKHIVFYNNKNIYDLRASNLKPMDKFKFDFIDWSANNWLKNHSYIYYEKSSRQWCVEMFANLPESRVRRYFKTKKEAKIFRNLVIEAVYGKDIFYLIRKYKKGGFI